MRAATGSTSGLWTPVVTFVTPGDLTVVYSVQQGNWFKSGRWVTLQWRINTSTFTFTTASGSLEVTGSPFTSSSQATTWEGVTTWAGITKAGFTQVNPSISNSANIITFVACGSAQAATILAATDTPTGGGLVLRGTLSFPI